MAKIRFPCPCGKSLAADETAAGKKAKCPNCGQVVQIPSTTAKAAEKRPESADHARKAAAPKRSATTTKPTEATSRGVSVPSTSTPASTSIWDDDIEKEFAGAAIDSQSALPAMPKSGAAVKRRTGIFATLANRPWWLNWVAFLVYVAIVWVVSRSSPMGSLLLVMPVFFLAVLIFLFGGVWYFLVLMRDDPEQAATLFLALLKSFVFGSSATKAGYQMGKANRGKPVNPSHARPIAIMKFGALGFAFSMGATLIVGILLGTWTKENLRRARFREFERSRPPMQRIEPQPPPVRFR